MQIDLGQEVTFKVSLGTKSYDLREPSAKEVMDFAEKAKGEEPIDAFVEFISSLGMPKDVASGLGIIKLKKLQEGLMGGLDIKK